jgi:hypothetical protein
MTRQYSSISVETTLASSINTTATTMTVATGTATALMGGISLAAGNVDIFTVALDADTVNEEIVFVTQVSGDTLTISRGQAGTGTAGVSGLSHTAGASVKHVLTSSDLIFFRNNASPVASFGFSGSTSGTTTVQATAVAGTNTLTLPATSNDTLVGKATTDTLTNKTLTSPVINYFYSCYLIHICNYRIRSLASVGLELQHTYANGQVAALMADTGSNYCLPSSSVAVMVLVLLLMAASSVFGQIQHRLGLPDVYILIANTFGSIGR